MMSRVGVHREELIDDEEVQQILDQWKDKARREAVHVFQQDQEFDEDGTCRFFWLICVLWSSGKFWFGESPSSPILPISFLPLR